MPLESNKSLVHLATFIIANGCRVFLMEDKFFPNSEGHCIWFMPHNNPPNAALSNLPSLSICSLWGPLCLYFCHKNTDWPIQMPLLNFDILNWPFCLFVSLFSPIKAIICSKFEIKQFPIKPPWPFYFILINFLLFSNLKLHNKVGHLAWIV